MLTTVVCNTVNFISVWEKNSKAWQLRQLTYWMLGLAVD